jgi:hypothetical protein
MATPVDSGAVTPNIEEKKLDTSHVETSEASGNLETTENIVDNEATRYLDHSVEIDEAENKRLYRMLNKRCVI